MQAQAKPDTALSGEKETPPHSLQYLKSTELEASGQPFAGRNYPKRTQVLSRREEFAAGPVTLALDAAANRARDTQQTGAKQNETLGFRDSGDRKTDWMTVVMRSVGNETDYVAA
jgi:hypothetical protein